MKFRLQTGTYKDACRFFKKLSHVQLLLNRHDNKTILFSACTWKYTLRDVDIIKLYSTFTIPERIEKDTYKHCLISIVKKCFIMNNAFDIPKNPMPSSGELVKTWKTTKIFPKDISKKCADLILSTYKSKKALEIISFKLSKEIGMEEDDVFVILQYLVIYTIHTNNNSHSTTSNSNMTYV